MLIKTVILLMQSCHDCMVSVLVYINNALLFVSHFVDL